MEESFSKKEKLKGKILIDNLFSEGKTLKKYPIRLIYYPLPAFSENNHKVGFSVPKRIHKKATDRNKIKRIMREAFRKNKNIVSNTLTHNYALMFIYTGREIASYQILFSATRNILLGLVEKETLKES